MHNNNKKRSRFTKSKFPYCKDVVTELIRGTTEVQILEKVKRLTWYELLLNWIALVSWMERGAGSTARKVTWKISFLPVRTGLEMTWFSCLKKRVFQVHCRVQHMLQFYWCLYWKPRFWWIKMANFTYPTKSHCLGKEVFSLSADTGRALCLVKGTGNFDILLKLLADW